MCHEAPTSTEASRQTPVSEMQQPRSHLFLVRVWIEDVSEGKAEWRGQVKHVVSGEVRYFRDWATLIEHLMAMSSSPQEMRNDTASISSGDEFEST